MMSMEKAILLHIYSAFAWAIFPIVFQLFKLFISKDFLYWWSLLYASVMTAHMFLFLLVAISSNHCIKRVLACYILSALSHVLAGCITITNNETNKQTVGVLYGFLVASYAVTLIVVLSVLSDTWLYAQEINAAVATQETTIVGMSVTRQHPQDEEEECSEKDVERQ